MPTYLRLTFTALFLSCVIALDACGSSPGLEKSAAESEVHRQWTEIRARDLESRKRGLESGKITAGGKTMQFVEKTYGPVPAEGRSLWISMHGGGGTTPEVNDGQYRNQQRLYEPAEGIW